METISSQAYRKSVLQHSLRTDSVYKRLIRSRYLTACVEYGTLCSHLQRKLQISFAIHNYGENWEGNANSKVATLAFLD